MNVEISIRMTVLDDLVLFLILSYHKNVNFDLLFLLGGSVIEQRSNDLTTFLLQV